MKTAIITGAYGVIGCEIARGMANAGYRTILVGRSLQKLESLRETLKKEFPDGELVVYPVDLSGKSQVFDLETKVDGPVDVLINNAATAPRSRIENEDGIEMQWATNVLSYYWMIKAFEGHLRASERGRVVNVASYWAGGLDLNDPEFRRRPYNNDQAYRQSKQADRMLTYGFAERFGQAISVNACHPGDANSKLSNDLGFGGSMSGRQSASTPLFLAIHEEVGHITGAYFAHSREAKCGFKADTAGIRRLMEVCESY